MNYVYSKLSKKDLNFVRLGGAGLGNILFTYARAVVFSQKNAVPLIWPTWPSLKLGPILRNEADKRFYHDLFSNRSGYVGGLKKWWIRLTKKKVAEHAKYEIENYDNCVVEFEGFENCFEEILDDSELVYQDLVKNLKPKNRKAWNVSFDDAICVHIRLGDFSKVSEQDAKNGRHNCSLPIDWYAGVLKTLRKIIGRNVKAYVFSDGTDEELSTVLRLPNVERITFGTAIADIFGLSFGKLLIASGSSFSMWARYLGRANTICFPGQMKQKILTPKDTAFEIEVDTDFKIPEEICGQIQTIFRSK